ncbi:41-2 protein antigen-related [Anaeramoeba flamelloides]|uniref:41-2 protein antigen-related n=1 Tax=Anaeramoeba flamelloides TaxID=1746091 RepID=A0AAV7YY55_9EUKA|nr:41-2 protein antigen-related [Anaeramoeba flamelloides]
MSKNKPQKNILDRPISRSKNNQISLNFYTFLFSQYVQYTREHTPKTSDLGKKLSKVGESIGYRLFELNTYKDKIRKRELKPTKILLYITDNFWKKIFGKAATLHRTEDERGQYMIVPESSTDNQFTELVFGHLVCSEFVAGLIKGVLNSAEFNAEISPAPYTDDIALYFVSTSQGRVITRKEPQGHLIGSLNPKMNQDLVQFNDWESLRFYLANLTKVNNYAGYGRDMILEDGIMMKTASAESVGGAASYGSNAAQPTYDHSTTNTQVEEVSEADILQLDSHGNLFAVNQITNKLEILKAYPTPIKKMSSIELVPGHVFEMFLSEKTKKLAIFSVTYHFGEPFTAVQVIDISDTQIPTELSIYLVQGNYQNSRMVDNQVYFITNSWLPWNFFQEEESQRYKRVYRDEKLIHFKPGDNFGPRYRILTTKTEIASFKKKMQSLKDSYYYDQSIIWSDDPKKRFFYPLVTNPSSIVFLKDDTPSTFVNIVSLSLDDHSFDDPNRNIKSLTLFGSGDKVYCSQKNLYVSYFSGNWFNRYSHLTKILQINLGKEIKLNSIFYVPGSIINQFAMDEDYVQKTFRVATTSVHLDEGRNIWNQPESQSSGLYVFDIETARCIGKIENLAPGERIYSVRFLGTIAHIVTFKQTDPLFVIDLSNSTNPTLKGYLKIPGFSNYLHPIDDNHLLGIGYDTKVVQNDAVIKLGVKVSLFDISDLENPKEQFSSVYGQAGSYCLIDQTHKAFLFDAKRNLIVLPLYLTNKDYNYKDRFVGLYVIRITQDEGFKVVKKISHTLKNNIFNQIKRSFWVEDYLYSLSNNIIQAHDLSDFQLISEINWGREFPIDK